MDFEPETASFRKMVPSLRRTATILNGMLAGMNNMFAEEELKLVSHRPSPLLTGNGMLSRDESMVCSEERQSSVERSISGTPSQNGDEIDNRQTEDLEEDNAALADESTGMDIEESTEVSMKRDLQDLQKGFIFMSHQMTRIMKALHVAPCVCEICAIRHVQANTARTVDDPTPILKALFPNATIEQLNSLATLAGKAPAQQKQQCMTQIGQNYAGLNGGGKIVGSAEKRLVADYAKTHAGLAKKYGVPPVSSYYQRKDSNQNLSGTANTSPGPSSEGEDTVENSINMPVLQPSQTASSNGQSAQIVQSQQHNTSRQNSSVSTSVPSSPMFPNGVMDMSAMMKMNAAHSTGSPGFLRGRGRGRPKLIGDELDADLVDYMVSVKQADPSGHLTASQALSIAKQYILDRAPGLLEEHGGHVKLKLTWAMKLVSRISERQKEMELGLPAGTLSNLGRQQLNNLPGGNLMADIMAQNILSQHMMIGNIGGQNTNSASAMIKEDKLAGEIEETTVIGAPEIVNVKELNLKFLKSLFEGGSVVDDLNGITEGELPFNDENELSKQDGTSTDELTISSRA
ncbi:unnamed protein product [Auanema sp. JU1783]|nr:unnamed protein product [Auanema sp. JU1783]